jgi:hypothetical protein
MMDTPKDTPKAQIKYGVYLVIHQDLMVIWQGFRHPIEGVGEQRTGVAYP